MGNIASLGNEVSPIDPDLGKETGLLHEMLITGRKVGATKDFFSKLAHDQEQFRKVIDVVYNGETLTVQARSFDIEERLSKQYKRTNGVDSVIFTRFSAVEFPTENFQATLVGGLDFDTPLTKVPAYLRLRGYRPLTLAEGMLLVETPGFLHPSMRQRHFPTLGTPTCDVDGTGVCYPGVGGCGPHDISPPNLMFTLWGGNQHYGRNDLPAIKL